PVLSDVRAVERGALAVFTTRSDGTGGFELSVDPGASYDVIASPVVPLPILSDTAVYARARVPAAVGSSGLTLAHLVLPAGLTGSGMVRDPGGLGAAGTRVEAYFGACADTEDPAAEAAAHSDGSFVIVVPEPR